MTTHYKRIFLRANGDGPWDCFFCGELVHKHSLTVHHVDGNHENIELTNIVPCHSGCHMSHHNRGKKLSPEHRAKISAGVRSGRRRPPVSDETRRRMSEAHRGKPSNFAGRSHTPDSRARISASLRARQS